MAMDPIFQFTDYKKYLTDVIQKNEGIRGFKSQLADAAGCQRSFMSQVLNSHVHLTPDHALGLAAFFQMNTETTEFFLEMVHYGRAATTGLRNHLLKRLKMLAGKQRQALAEVKSPSLGEIEHQSIYYSSWHWSALHVGIQVPGLNNESALAERLQLPVAMIRQSLTILQSMGLAEKDKGQWRATQKNLHAPANSIHSWLHHSSWRQKANENMRNTRKESIHFTGVYSLSAADIERISDHVIRLIETTNKVVGPSAEEDMACLCLDWYSV